MSVIRIHVKLSVRIFTLFITCYSILNQDIKSTNINTFLRIKMHFFFPDFFFFLDISLINNHQH